MATAMKTDAVQVCALEDYRIEVVLKDGRCGRFDMTPYLEFGAFQQLREPGYFKQVDVQFGAVTWPQGQDISPESLVSGMTWIAD